MSEDLFQGYKGKALETLKKFKVNVWDDAEIESTGGHFSGKILPRAENTNENHLVLKLSTGYNIGIHIETITKISGTNHPQPTFKIPEKVFPYTQGLPHVKLLGTGGTIASRLDYRTGAVIPAFAPGELYGAVPELADICNLETEKIFAVFSENMGPQQYIALAKKIGEEIEKGIDGIVIGHGTDTLQHTGAALSFMCQNLPIPVILVGSQRSSDRPSSDAALNLMHAMTAAAHGNIAEVMICMFGPTSDEYGFLHKGTRVRKMHSSYRSTFRTIGDTPLARVTRQGVFPIKTHYNIRRNDRNVNIIPTFDDRVSMLYYHPGMKADVLDSLIEKGYKGIIWVGTGLGHINKEMYPAVERAHAAGLHQYMTLQTIWGYVNMFVYDTGRDMMAKGIIPAGNMLPEVALIKLGWALGQTDDPKEVKRLMLTPINDEITLREPYNGYLVYQGGVPEVEEFIKKVHK
ncbi:MAG: Glu-tRNA(Gln) amidotransferase subunit GatD [Bacteroidales bacterium]|jgi:glutamyl-tRNA(Gln) amidotransferase subunit D|nr:Glu-tRNA(Gln) amidotransferase subunit GatD [Bacteroidales bacterium]MDD2687354.1 Glu-tRNA(Gln) amidotransferase subunit GatD [Bacteroidales bacterium]MDD3331233.1 Glu-tRNA(Gln) amidotransferase subunit GatD [Bacteroidales bacterium]MDD3691321.1 Glu-tRNA(Gln) amidotransferase subunit GatD [Bacteroidales bacterium]MDD4044513.1 Glu-tRNA(Gln) amidotransferase subunit GatD [Bacteroidales bacterium]